MKKWLLILLAVFMISIAGIYIFIPARLTVTESVPVTATQEGTIRMFSTRQNWNKIWPGGSGMTYRSDNPARKQDTSFYYMSGGFDFYLKKILYNAIELTIETNNDSIESAIYILPYQVDSFKLQWTALLPSTNNPIKRVQNYFKATKLSSCFKFVLKGMGNTLSKVQTIYGIEIKKDTIPYQNYIATKRYLTQYPSTETIYTMVDELQQYAVKTGARQLDKPIFDVKTTEESEYTTQVAIPIDKIVLDNGPYSNKWMMKGGNVLSTDVQGDMNELEKAKAQVNQYIADYRRSIIAAPWQMLITDRRAEPDSTKWITRLYIPVI